MVIASNIRVNETARWLVGCMGKYVPDRGRHNSLREMRRPSTKSVLLLWPQERILSIEGGSSRSHYVEESFWKRLWTCRLTDYWWWWWRAYLKYLTNKTTYEYWYINPNAVLMLYIWCYEHWKPGRLRNVLCRNSVCGSNNQRSHLYSSRPFTVTEEEILQCGVRLLRNTTQNF